MDSQKKVNFILVAGVLAFIAYLTFSRGFFRPAMVFVVAAGQTGETFSASAVLDGKNTNCSGALPTNFVLQGENISLKLRKISGTYPINLRVFYGRNFYDRSLTKPGESLFLQIETYSKWRRGVRIDTSTEDDRLTR